MQHSAIARRQFLAAAGGLTAGVVAAAAAIAASPARALEVPTGPVLLTVTGSLAHPNNGAAACFDLALLQTLPRSSFSTKTPWYPQARKFDGVLLRDLLAALGAPPAAGVRAAALNDYRVDIPADDLSQNGAMLAYLLDDRPMAVRDKGPLVIIFPFDDRPALRTAVHYGRAIWQLCSLDIT